jgi:hypothetical protein
MISEKSMWHSYARHRDKIVSATVSNPRSCIHFRVHSDDPSDVSCTAPKFCALGSVKAEKLPGRRETTQRHELGQATCAYQCQRTVEQAVSCLVDCPPACQTGKFLDADQPRGEVELRMTQSACFVTFPGVSLVWCGFAHRECPKLATAVRVHGLYLRSS